MLTLSQLKKWHEQVERDCPEGKWWIIFNKPNAGELIVIFSEETLDDSGYIGYWDFIEVGESVHPAKKIKEASQKKILDRILRRESKSIAPHICHFPLSDMETENVPKILCFMRAEDFIKHFPLDMTPEVDADV